MSDCALIIALMASQTNEGGKSKSDSFSPQEVTLSSSYINVNVS
jgi:hypothetical protein